VEARVDEESRADTMRNHTATHILHAALRQVLGTHARQAGSLVTPERLRFDFTHMEAMTPAQIREVELLANRIVREDMPVQIQELPYDQALEAGAMAFFGDKYADVVRVVGVCPTDAPHDEKDCFSLELCGGTHVHSSGFIGSIVITAETSIGAGLRRIEAVTGRAAAQRVRENEEALSRLSASLRVPVPEVETRLAGLREENDSLRKELQAAQRRLAQQEAALLTRPTTDIPMDGFVEEIGGITCTAQRLHVSTVDALRAAGDTIKSQLKSNAVILLSSVIDGKAVFIAMVTPDAAKKCPAGDVVRAAAQAAGGGGGGRPELAQGAGDSGKLEAGVAAAHQVMREKLRASQ